MKISFSKRIVPVIILLGVGAVALYTSGCGKKSDEVKATGGADTTMSMPGMKMPMTKTSDSQGNAMSNMSSDSGSMSGMSMPGMKMPMANNGTASGKGDVPRRVPVELSSQQQQFIDVRTKEVASGDAVVTIRAVGIVAYDETRLNNVNTRVMGWAEKLYVDKPGQFVRRGDLLMDLYSPDLYSAEDEYLIAYRAAQRFDNVSPQDGPDTTSVVWQESAAEARDLLKSTRKRLQLWQISDEEIATLEKSGHASDTEPIRAPFTGYVIQKNIDPAQMAMPGKTLFVLADLSTVWVNAQLYESDLPYAKPGQDVIITAVAHPGQVYHAKVDFIYPYSDNPTRTTTARLVMDNRNGTFKPGDYVNAVIHVDEGRHLLIPSTAVYDTGVDQYVFVQADNNGRFVPHRIKLGPYVEGKQVVVSAGLSAGEKIVVDGNFMLDSESQLQAGTSGGSD